MDETTRDRGAPLLGSRVAMEGTWPEEATQQSNRLLLTLRQVQSEFILDTSPERAFLALLDALMDVTRSEYGFIGEVLREEDGTPYLKTRAITDISWDEASRALYEDQAATGLEFRNLETLFGAVLTTGEPVLANGPATDPRRGGIPPGHPPLRSFAGLPFRHASELVGMVGLANRRNGYETGLVDFLQPLLATCGTIIAARRVEKRRVRAEEALAESEAIFRQMAETIEEVFWMSEPGTGRIPYVSAAFETIWGRPGTELQEDPMIWLEAVHPDHRPTVEAAYRRQLEGRATVEEYRIVRPDGQDRWVRDRAFPILDSEGRVFRITGIAEDITQRKKLEEQLLQSEKMQAIGTLAGGIAHEFNNILTAMLGYADLTLREMPVDSPTRQHLGHITEAGHRARELVRQILTYSRRHPPERRYVRLNGLVSEALSLIRATLPATVEIRERLSEEGCHVLADPTQVHQVLMNLCANAEHAMRSGGGVLDVIVEPVDVDAELADTLPGITPGPHVKLVVRDTGHGISPDLLDRIGDPFFTTKGPGEGTGMGLSIVQAIVTAHDGAATVDSALDEGTTFTIYLPQLQSEARESDASVKAPFEPGEGRVLFVDDEPAIARLAEIMLDRLGFEVDTRLDGRSALEAFRLDPDAYRVVITDQTMPDMTGTRLIELLRQIRADIPVILSTGFSPSVDARAASELGFDAYFMKPFDLSELQQVLSNALASRDRAAK